MTDSTRTKRVTVEGIDEHVCEQAVRYGLAVRRGNQYGTFYVTTAKGDWAIRAFCHRKLAEHAEQWLREAT